MSNPIPDLLALTLIADGSKRDAAPLRNNFSAIQTALNEFITALKGGSAGQVLEAIDATDVQWQSATAKSTQTFNDSGQTDFFSNGLWLVEVSAPGGALVGAATVYCGTNTATGTRHIVVLASAANSSGIVPTFAAISQDTNAGVFRVSTAAASGLTVTVTYRRMQGG